MQNKTIGILAGILLILPLGFVNTAVAHTGGNEALPSPNRADYVYSTNFNVPCDVVGWNQTSSTSTLMGDADGDAICDGWELSSGLLIAFRPPAGRPGAGQNFTYSYPCGSNPGQDPQCPSRNHKDVYLELDWMEDSGNSHVPATGVVQSVKDAWAAGNVTNLDGITGIILHVQNGEWPAASSSSQQGDIQWHNSTLYTNLSSDSSKAGFYRLKQHTFGTMDERFAAGGSSYAYNGTFQKNANYTLAAVKNPLSAKFQIFHYALIINQRQEAGQSTSSGWAEIYGNDHVWSLGGWTPAMGNASLQKAVFMHELGHNFNLDHGGENSTSAYKPNYFSVMNPTFQFESPDPCRPLDYSTQAMQTLDENNLSEPNGVKNAAGTGGYLYSNSSPCNVGQERFFWYNTTNGSVLDASDRTNQAVNWDPAAPIDTQTGLSRSINLNNTKEILTSRNDWTDLKFDFFLGPFFSGSSAGGLPDADAPPTYRGDDCPDVPSDIAGETPMFAQSFTTGCRELTFENVLAFPGLITISPPGEETGEIDSPYVQQKNGVPADQVKCKDDLKLAIKTFTGKGVCLTEDTKTKLIKRDWVK